MVRRTEEHFNGLTPGQAERLAHLIEEAGEVIQIASKILRHGFDSKHPEDIYGPTNRKMLEKELGDFLFVFSLMSQSGDVAYHEVQSSRARKRETVWPFYHHQEQV